jgi:hypothetical protein
MCPTVKDIRWVFFALPPRKARQVIVDAGIRSEVKIEERAGFAHCSVKLAADDPRFVELLSLLQTHGERPLVRADRSWSRRELDASPRLLLRVVTAGLDGGIGFGQPYDRSAACSMCGAGSRPLPPLRADLPRMGKKQLDATAYDGLLVVSTAVVAVLDEHGVTGYETAPVRSRSDRYPTGEHRWLNVTGELPRCREDSILQHDDPCRTCGRSGHYDTYDRFTELRYDALPPNTPDLARTWEYWGNWRGLSEHERVGGSQVVVVSQKARRALVEAGVRRIAFEPVTVRA